MAEQSLVGAADLRRLGITTKAAEVLINLPVLVQIMRNCCPTFAAVNCRSQP